MGWRHRRRRRQLIRLVGDVVAGARVLGIEGAGAELKLVQKLGALTVLVLDE